MFVNTELKDKCTCLCDFAKRCPLRFRLNTSEGLVHASVAGKKKTKNKTKTGGLPSCQVSAESPGPDLSAGGWYPCSVSEPEGVGRGDFVTLIRVSSQKAVQIQRIFPVV